jgi:hypothetical protein
MFKSNDDLKKALEEIRKIKDFLEMHTNTKLSNQTIPKQTLMEYEKMRVNINFFREFVQKVMQSMGLSERDLAMSKDNIKRDPKLEALYKEADTLKCQLLINEAKFFRTQMREFLDSNRPFHGSYAKTQGAKDHQKKRVKKKFKTMNQRMKWNKM